MYIFFYITLLLLLAYGLLIEYYRRAWNTITEPGDQHTGLNDTTVTVIIPARNEENNIRACLDAVTQQSYPASLVEIMVMDDHSTDATSSIVAAYPDQRIRLMRLQDHISNPLNSYKKKAIELAIAHSSGELIITTDADCTMQKNWIEKMVNIYRAKQAVFIAAPVRLSGNRSLLSIFQSLDFISLQGITGASVFKGIHTMCNGANLAYERKAFAAVDGFSGIDSIASGDDMLLMYKIYKMFPDRIFFLKSRDAIVSTAPMLTWNDFINQRIRWASKAGHYDDKRIFSTLLFVYILNCCILFFPIAAFWKGHALVLFGLLWVGKTILEYPFVYTVAEFFGKQQLMNYFFFLQPLHILYTVVAGWLGKFGTYRWKDRVVK